MTEIEVPYDSICSLNTVNVVVYPTKDRRHLNWSESSMLPSTALSIFHSLLALFNSSAPTSSRLPLELRHLHAVSPEGHVVFQDTPQQYNLAAPYTVNTRRIKSHRPSSFEAFSNARISSLRFAQSMALDWDEDEILGPDVEDRDTLLTLAKMTNNAYLEPNDAQWYDLGANWTVVRPPPAISCPQVSTTSFSGISIRLGTGSKWL